MKKSINAKKQVKGSMKILNKDGLAISTSSDYEVHLNFCSMSKNDKSHPISLRLKSNPIDGIYVKIPHCSELRFARNVLDHARRMGLETGIYQTEKDEPITGIVLSQETKLNQLKACIIVNNDKAFTVMQKFLARNRWS